MVNLPGAVGTIPGLALAVMMGSVGMAAAQGLPGGATSLNETHGDWTVVCTTRVEVADCAITQTQVSSENRQRVLAVELTTAEGGNAARGMLVLPFGLRLDAGVRLAIEERVALDPLRFSTCLPAGCIVPLEFDPAAVTALRAGMALSATVTANDGSQELVFAISLMGFSSAFNRISELNGR